MIENNEEIFQEMPISATCFFDCAKRQGMMLYNGTERAADTAVQDDGKIIFIWQMGEYDYAKWNSDIVISEFEDFVPAAEDVKVKSAMKRPASAKAESAMKRPAGAKTAMKRPAAVGVPMLTLTDDQKYQLTGAMNRCIQREEDSTNKGRNVSYKFVFSRFYHAIRPVVTECGLPKTWIGIYVQKGMAKLST